jgi:hypothetical protein
MHTRQPLRHIFRGDLVSGRTGFPAFFWPLPSDTLGSGGQISSAEGSEESEVGS